MTNFDDAALLQRLLSKYIRSIYANEMKFVERFFPTYPPNLELEECYFASNRVRIVLVNPNTTEIISTTLKTEDVCSWVDSLG